MEQEHDDIHMWHVEQMGMVFSVYGQQTVPSPEIKDISSPLTIISGISYYTPEQKTIKRIHCGGDLLFAPRLPNLPSTPAYFYCEKDLRINLFASKIINKYDRRFEAQRCSCLTSSVIVLQMASHHLLDMENKGYSGALGSFLMGDNGNFTRFLNASNSVAVNSNESSY